MAVRWDAVVQDKGFWSEPEKSSAPASREASPVCVQVWLFGSLATHVSERPVTLQLELPFCVDDLIAELGRRCGAELFASITTPAGGKARNCRVFVDGELVSDTKAPIRNLVAPAQVELILLSALEGG